MARLLFAPVFFSMVGDEPSWPALGTWFLLCVSDAVDGRLARRHGTTRSGAFLDPLADKVLVLGAMFALVAHHLFWIVPVLIIAAREILISIYRTVAARAGVTVPATKAAKYKTLVQQLAVAAMLLPPLADRSRVPANLLLWAAVALTVSTGAHYVLTAQQRARAQVG